MLNIRHVTRHIDKRPRCSNNEASAVHLTINQNASRTSASKLASLATWVASAQLVGITSSAARGSNPQGAVGSAQDAEPAENRCQSRYRRLLLSGTLQPSRGPQTLLGGRKESDTQRSLLLKCSFYLRADSSLERGSVCLLPSPPSVGLAASPDLDSHATVSLPKLTQFPAHTTQSPRQALPLQPGSAECYGKLALES